CVSSPLYAMDYW
nr:immunoglobulin heavy chain junction region [Mus musculus]